MKNPRRTESEEGVTTAPRRIRSPRMDGLTIKEKYQDMKIDILKKRFILRRKLYPPTKSEPVTMENKRREDSATNSFLKVNLTNKIGLEGKGKFKVRFSTVRGTTRSIQGTLEYLEQIRGSVRKTQITERRPKR
jgi:hypothetical protein